MGSGALREVVGRRGDGDQEVGGLVHVWRDGTRERGTERALRFRNRLLAALKAIAAATTMVTRLLPPGLSCLVVSSSFMPLHTVYLAGGLRGQRWWLLKSASGRGASLSGYHATAPLSMYLDIGRRYIFRYKRQDVGEARSSNTPPVGPLAAVSESACGVPVREEILGGNRA